MYGQILHTLPMEISSQIDSELIHFFGMGKNYNAKLIHTYI